MSVKNKKSAPIYENCDDQSLQLQLAEEETQVLRKKIDSLLTENGQLSKEIKQAKLGQAISKGSEKNFFHYIS